MIHSKSKGEIVFKAFNILFMLFMVILTIYPLMYVLFASLSDSTEMLAHSGILVKPLGFNVAAYKMVSNDPTIYKGYMNTIFIVVAGCSLNILLTSLGAYVLSRKNVMWKSLITFLIVFTMYFSGGMIPFYLTVKNVGLNDSLLALILPTAVNTFNLLILRTGFSAIPDSLEESAKLDGAGNWAILFKIIIPLSLPTISVVLLYYAVAHWNAWFNAMLFIRSSDKYPLQLVLRSILITNETAQMDMGTAMGEKLATRESIKYAAIIVSVIPIMLVYPFLQKYFVKGTLVGAVKE